MHASLFVVNGIQLKLPEMWKGGTTFFSDSFKGQQSSATKEKTDWVILIMKLFGQVTSHHVAESRVVDDTVVPAYVQVVGPYCGTLLQQCGEASHIFVHAAIAIKGMIPRQPEGIM